MSFTSRILRAKNNYLSDWFLINRKGGNKMAKKDGKNEISQ